MSAMRSAFCIEGIMCMIGVTHVNGRIDATDLGITKEGGGHCKGDSYESMSMMELPEVASTLMQVNVLGEGFVGRQPDPEEGSIDVEHKNVSTLELSERSMAPKMCIHRQAPLDENDWDHHQPFEEGYIRVNDVQMSGKGIDSCKWQCKSRGNEFKWFGFECPRNGKGGQVHCQCATDDVAGTWDNLGLKVSESFCRGQATRKCGSKERGWESYIEMQYWCGLKHHWSYKLTYDWNQKHCNGVYTHGEYLLGGADLAMMYRMDRRRR